MGFTSEIFPSQHATVKPAQAGPAIMEHFAMDNLKVSKFRGKNHDGGSACYDMLCFSNSASYVSAIPWHYALQILGHAHMFWLNFVRTCWFAVFYFVGQASGNQIPRKHHMHSYAASVNHMYPKVSTILLSTYPLVTVQPASPTTSWKSCKILRTLKRSMRSTMTGRVTVLARHAGGPKFSLWQSLAELEQSHCHQVDEWDHVWWFSDTVGSEHTVKQWNPGGSCHWYPLIGSIGSPHLHLTYPLVI